MMSGSDDSDDSSVLTADTTLDGSTSSGTSDFASSRAGCSTSSFFLSLESNIVVIRFHKGLFAIDIPDDSSIVLMIKVPLFFSFFPFCVRSVDWGIFYASVVGNEPHKKISDFLIALVFGVED
jgi:hypothetical protein